MKVAEGCDAKGMECSPRRRQEQSAALHTRLFERYSSNQEFDAPFRPDARMSAAAGAHPLLLNQICKFRRAFAKCESGDARPFPICITHWRRRPG
jgi:hypothetical protein